MVSASRGQTRVGVVCERQNRPTGPTFDIPDIRGVPMTLNFRIHSEDLVPAIQSLEEYFREGGASIVQAAFQHTYFAHPEAVLNRTPYFPERARYSRQHYPGIDKGQATTWKAGDGREIILDDNSRAQMAWGEVYRPQTSPGGPATGSAISGETPTTPMRSPLAGICVICPSGLEC